MSEDTLRTVRVERTGPSRFKATNVRGEAIEFGTGDEPGFTPVELLLAALGGCTAADVDVATRRHAEPAEFTATVTGDKIADELGSRLINLAVSFRVAFPEGREGDAARAILPRAVRSSHDRLCTVSRTVEIGTPVATAIEAT
jgi:uncharacterized OsmC-like protein